MVKIRYTSAVIKNCKSEVINMLVTLDKQNRITLGKLLTGISAKLFDAKLEDGKIVLEPMEAIPEREMWLHKNPDALASVLRGLEDAQKGKIKPFDPDKD